MTFGLHPEIGVFLRGCHKAFLEFHTFFKCYGKASLKVRDLALKLRHLRRVAGVLTIDTCIFNGLHKVKFLKTCDASQVFFMLGAFPIN